MHGQDLTSHAVSYDALLLSPRFNQKYREITIPCSSNPACDGGVRDGGLFSTGSEQRRGRIHCSFLGLEAVAGVSLGCGWSAGLEAVEN